MKTFNERIDKIIASTGTMSRSEAKKAAKKGLILLNGTVIKDCSIKATERDELIVKNKRIEYQKYIYVMLNKPKGYVCSTDDPSSPIVNVLLNEELQRLNLFSIGRLDKNTTGLVILTNDGDLAHRLISPSKHVDKIYEVTTKQPIQSNYREAFKNGITLDDGYRCMPAGLEVTGEQTCRVTIKEGKYHQIKRMFDSLGNKVVELNRISIGCIPLDNGLKQGEYRVLTVNETEALCGMQPQNSNMCAICTKE